MMRFSSKKKRMVQRVFYDKVGYFRKRSVLVDLDDPQLENEQVLVGRSYGTGCNWSVGAYEKGTRFIVSNHQDSHDLQLKLMDSIRKQTELCDSLQGFQVRTLIRSHIS